MGGKTGGQRAAGSEAAIVLSTIQNQQKGVL